MLLRRVLLGRKIVLCFGAGVDSTAVLLVLRAAGIRPDIITFANTGGEKPETLEHIARVNVLLREWGWPEIVICVKQTLSSTPYNTLEGECLANATLPSLAFGLKTCSLKWKMGPQDQYIMGAQSGPNAREPQPLWIEAEANGERIVKLIGYDSSPADIRRRLNWQTSGGDGPFDNVYPLQLIGWHRVDCVEAIVETLGLELLPIKSACFFCPASKHWELYWLAAVHPELLERALLMERVALAGKHSWLKDLEFGEEWESSIQGVKRFPGTKGTVGLGRSFSWNHWARVNGVVNERFEVYREKADQFACLARALQEEEDNALDIRSCA